MTTGMFKTQLIEKLKYVIYSSVICIFFISCGSMAPVTSYESYSVKEGETVQSIAKDRNISESMIYNLNPDSRNGLKANSILILPARKDEQSQEPSTEIATSDDTDTKPSSSKSTKGLHTVQPGETLYGLSKKYGVTIEAIKQHNKELYTRELRNGERIVIPQVPKDEIKIPIIKLPPGTQEYEIQPKDTRYGIARKFNISVTELENLNPNLPDVLTIGDKIIVPSSTYGTDKATEEEIDNEFEDVSDELTEDDSDESVEIIEEYEYYVVQPKEGFYRLKVKFGVTEEEVIALNPSAAEGLKPGMILKLPKPGAEISKEDLEDKIENREMKNLALMLPFRLTRSEIDSTQSSQELLKKDPTLRIALDFYSGAVIAAEFAKEKGISVTLNVYDTEQNEGRIASIISDSNFKKTDAVIGPLLQKNVEKASSLLADRNIPVFSPLSNRDMNMSPNLFQTIPTNSVLESTIIRYLKANAHSKNIIVIADSKQQRQKQSVLNAIPSARQITISGNYLNGEEITNVLSSDKENWIVLASSQAILVSNVVNTLSNLSTKNDIRLFALERSDAFEWDEVSSSQLANLHFTFPSVNRSFTDNLEPFITRYKEKHGVAPNRFAIRGFDLTYDVLLRLASEDNLYDALSSTSETVYIENKFRYEKTGKSGYSNQAAYILKYTNDLNFEVVE